MIAIVQTAARDFRMFNILPLFENARFSGGYSALYLLCSIDVTRARLSSLNRARFATPLCDRCRRHRPDDDHRRAACAYDAADASSLLLRHAPGAAVSLQRAHAP